MSILRAGYTCIFVKEDSFHLEDELKYGVYVLLVGIMRVIYIGYFFSTCIRTFGVKAEKAMYGIKYILSYYIPIQTIVSPYDANCVTPLIYPTTYLDFLFVDNCLDWLKFLFHICLNLHTTFLFIDRFCNRTQIIIPELSRHGSVIKFFLSSIKTFNCFHILHGHSYNFSEPKWIYDSSLYFGRFFCC